MTRQADSLFLRLAVMTAALCLLLVVTTMAATIGQDTQDKHDPVQWSLKTDVAARPVKPGEKFTAQIVAEIQSGWHLYSMTEVSLGPKPTRIILVAEQPFEIVGDLDAPAPLTAFDQNFGAELEYYEQAVTFTLPLRVAAKAAAGKQKLTMQVRYQSCNDTLCLPPKLIRLDTEIEIRSAQ